MRKSESAVISHFIRLCRELLAKTVGYILALAIQTVSPNPVKYLRISSTAANRDGRPEIRK